MDTMYSTYFTLTRDGELEAHTCQPDLWGHMPENDEAVTVGELVEEGLLMPTKIGNAGTKIHYSRAKVARFTQEVWTRGASKQAGDVIFFPDKWVQCGTVGGWNGWGVARSVPADTEVTCSKCLKWKKKLDEFEAEQAFAKSK